MSGVEQEQRQIPQPDTSRGDLAIAGVISTLVNVGYILIAPGDQRVLILLMVSLVAGMVMLAGEKSGPYGMGVIFGVAAAVAISVALALTGLSPHDFTPDPKHQPAHQTSP